MSIPLIIYTIIGFIVALGYFINKYPVLVFVGQIINLAYTLVHEFAHAFVSVLVEQRVAEMRLNFDTSGHVVSYVKGKRDGLLVTFAGYTLPCVISLVLYMLLEAGRASIVLFVLVAIAGFSFVFIRNWYGFLWIAGFIALLVTVYLYTTPTVIEHVAMFLSAVIFAGSVYGGWRIFIYSMKHPENAGDATNLAERTFFPAQVWGFIFFLISAITFVAVPFYFYGSVFMDVPYLEEIKLLLR